MTDMTTLAKIPFFYGHKDNEVSVQMQLKRWSDEFRVSELLAKQALPQITFLVYDTEEHSRNSKNIELTIQSIKNQTYPAWRIAISNPGLTEITIIANGGKTSSLRSGEEVFGFLAENSEDWLIVLRLGDICSPSLGFTVMQYCASNKQVLYWGYLRGELARDSIKIKRSVDIASIDILSEQHYQWHSFAARAGAKLNLLRSLQRGDIPILSLIHI